MSAARLEGKIVLGLGGVPLGRVRHILLDLSTGRIAFLVIDLVGTDRRRLCAVPWIAFGPDPAQMGLMLAHLPEELRTAPTFPVDNWPSFGDPDWLHSVYRFFCPPLSPSHSAAGP